MTYFRQSNYNSIKACVLCGPSVYDEYLGIGFCVEVRTLPLQILIGTFFAFL